MNCAVQPDMNSYINLNRVEFLVTRTCTGHCKHCSVISSSSSTDTSYPDLDTVIAALTHILEAFPIESIMTYGGEPLLYPDITATILQMATTHGVKSRELITNGYFSNDPAFIASVVAQVVAAGVNDIKLSIDAFHQERIPLHYVELFITALLSRQFGNLTIHPAWLVSRDHDNAYNNQTRVLIEHVSSKYGLAVSAGNDIDLSGLAKENLWTFYPKRPIDLDRRCGEMHFTNSLTNVRSLRILPNGDVAICRALIIGNLFGAPMASILRGYEPYTHVVASVLLNAGLRGLHGLAESSGGTIRLEEYRNPCDLCADCVKLIGHAPQSLPSSEGQLRFRQQ